jgi:hypothetical protein
MTHMTMREFSRDKLSELGLIGDGKIVRVPGQRMWLDEGSKLTAIDRVWSLR